MKNIIIATTLVLASGFAAANTMPANGGFNGPTEGMQTTVEQALKANDDTPVQITGTITHALGDEDYQFTDGTNTIVVEIDDRVWQGVDVTPQDTVIITGSLDKDAWEDATIDVNRIVIASK
ncbi:YgiW/YdeI family stress tolerance OB fold protein [Vibrio cionasavignyae]|uniref:YgiW/YdeI family stress tolerance OB fold protein n=1 Tax=Vibrio cionasavignyae TaxID=2910252 RepID=UPI003D147F49